MNHPLRKTISKTVYLLCKGFSKTVDLISKPFYGTEIITAFITLTEDVVTAYEDQEDREAKRVLHTKHHTRRL